MTYVIGWKDEANVYIIADSALSSNIENDKKSKTSFGETEMVYHNYFVNEGVLKITIVNKKYLISYAGDTTRIYSALEFIQDNLRLGQNIYDVVGSASKSIPCDNYELVIGFFDEKPILLHFNGKETIEKEFVQIGSGSLIFRDTVSNFIKKYLQTGDPNWKLVVLVSALQCQSVKDVLIEYGVGGMFNGARVSSGEISWCNDITYCLYDEDDLSTLKTVTVMSRDSSIFVSSEYKKESPNKVFFGWNVRTQDFIENWKRKGISLLDDLKSDYYIFYSVVTQCLRIIYVNKQVQNDYFRLWVKHDGGNFHHFFALSVKLGDELKLPSSIEYKIAIPFPYMTRKDYIIKFNDQSSVPDYEDVGFK